MSLPLKVLPSPQMLTSSSFMAATSMVPVTARPMRRGVEVGDAGGRDVEGAALQRGDAFGHQLAAAVDQAGLFGAVLQGAARDFVVVRFVGLAQVGGVGVGHGALFRASSEARRSCPDRRRSAMPTFWPTGMCWRMVAIAYRLGEENLRFYRF